jgi:photosystem II stability/assembly factor-like uncharacterized protein
MGKIKFSIALLMIALLMGASYATLPVSASAVWKDLNPTAYISPPANPSLNSVYMLSQNEGWAVGDSRPTNDTIRGLPAIFHYDGSSWNLVLAPKFPDFPSTQSAYNLTSVSFGPPNNPIIRTDGWAVGFNGTFLTGAKSPNATALHWDGITWRVQTAGLLGLNAGPLWSVFMVSPTDVWAVGQNRTGTAVGGTFWHWTGVPGLGGGWNLVQPPVWKVVFYSLFMVSSSEGWAVGSGGAIWHYFGGAWTAVSTPVTTTTLRSVYMLSQTDGWAVGDGGVILHYTAGTWSGPVSPGTTSNNLLSVFMASSTEGWAAGKLGTILHYSGGAWTSLPSNLVPTAPVSFFNFTSVYFNTASDGWGVGTDGVILHFDGSNWGTVTSPTINNFTSISFGPPLTGPVNPNDVWAVGNASATPTFEPTIYHWNGFMWTKGIAIGTMNNLNSVFMLNTADVWTVGGGSHATASCATTLCPIILHFTGGSWNTITPPAGSYTLKSVFMVSSTEGWAVGEQAGATGIILHYTVTGGVGTWAIFPSPASPSPIHSLNSVFMLQANEGWAVGDNATILHYAVTGGVGTWNVVPVSGTPSLSSDANLTSIFMLSPTSGWVVGGIQASGSYSAGPVILYWDGTKWTPVATPSMPGGISPTGHTSATLKTVYCSSANDCWAAGLPGKLFATLFHWDGVAWSHITTTPALLGEVPPILTSIYLTGPGMGWIVGSDPAFPGPGLAFPSGAGALSTILRSMASFQTVTSTVVVTTVLANVTTVTVSGTGTGASTSTILTSTTTGVTVTPTTSTSTSAFPPPVLGGGLSSSLVWAIVGIVVVVAVVLVLLLLLLWRRRPRPPVVLYPLQRRPY